jgi:DNA ligase-1
LRPLRRRRRRAGKYPDVIARLPKYFDHEAVKSFIIDCEVVAFDRVEQRILPFQTLSHRKRKDVQGEDVEVQVRRHPPPAVRHCQRPAHSPPQVCLFAFDMIFLNGEVRWFRAARALASC